MVELLREGMDAGAIGLSAPACSTRTGAAADVDELALLARHRRRGRRHLHDAHPRRAWTRSSTRSTRRSQPARRGGVPVVDLASQVRGAAATGAAPCETLAAHRRRARAAADRARRLSVRRRLDRAAQGHGRRHHRRPRHLVDAASGDGGAHAGRHRARVGLHAAGGLRAAAARRRVLFPDARGRRAARARASGDDDRLGRPAARPASASAAVGNVSPRARPLQPRPRPVSARDRRAQDDGPVGAPVSTSPIAARSANGAYADVVVFDAATIRDAATFDRPKVLSQGIECVLVAGEIAYRDGGVRRGSRSGRFLAHGREVGSSDGKERVSALSSHATGSISTSCASTITISGDRSSVPPIGGISRAHRPQERKRQRVQQARERAVGRHPRQDRLHEHDDDQQPQRAP